MAQAPRFIVYEDLRLRGISFSKVHLWRLERKGEFPKRVALSLGRHAWIETEIDAWIADRIAARDRTQAA